MNSLLIFLFGTTVALAATPKKYYLDTDFQYKSGDRKVSTKNKLVITDSGNDWTMLSNSTGLLLQARMVKADKDFVHVEYKLTDTTKGEHVISNPSILSKIGNEAEIEQETEGSKDKLKLKMVARPL